MARIVFGVMGDSRGHFSRSLALAGNMKGHEIVFAGGGVVSEARDHGYEHMDLPMLETVLKGGRVKSRATALNTVRVISGRRKPMNRLAGFIRDFKPDLVVSDYEYFTQRAAIRAGVPCVSLDNQHALTNAKGTPPGERFNRFVTTQSIKRLFSKADRYFVTSFYAPRATHERTEIFPPIIRPAVTRLEPVHGSHILVYLRGGERPELIDRLRRGPRKAILYGSKNIIMSGQLECRTSNDQFLEDLRSCAYVVSNGGHSLICEALYLGKPVLSFPVNMFYEQYVNAFFLARRGFGSFIRPNQDVDRGFDRFEQKLEKYRERIARGDFYGNDLVAARLEELAANGC